MMNYYEYISQFQIYSTQKEASKKGFEAHHITPRAVQIEKCGRVVDDSCVRLTRSQHVKAHYLYCLAYPEQSSQKYALQLLLNGKDINLAEDELDEYCRYIDSWVRQPMSEETRKKMSEAKKGEKNSRYGKHHSEETKRRMSEAHTGKPRSEETRKRLSEVRKGNQYALGCHRSKETRCKISSSNAAPKLSQEYKLYKSAGGALNWNQWRHYRKETNNG